MKYYYFLGKEKNKTKNYPHTLRCYLLCQSQF